MRGGEQHGDRVLAVVTDRAGAVPFERKQHPVASEIVFDRDGIGFGPAARNLAVNPAGRGRTRPNAPCRARNSPAPAGTRLPDRALDVVCSEGFQAGLSIPHATDPLPERCSFPHGRGIRRHCGARYARRCFARLPCASTLQRAGYRRITLFSNGRQGQGRARSRTLRRRSGATAGCRGPSASPSSAPDRAAAAPGCRRARPPGPDPRRSDFAEVRVAPGQIESHALFQFDRDTCRRHPGQSGPVSARHRSWLSPGRSWRSSRSG